MIPKLSAPLVKDIRTGEGILEWALTGLGVIAGATGNLSIAHTALYVTILAVVKGARRGLIKVLAGQGTLGIGAPLQPAVLGEISKTVADAAPTVGSVLAEITAAQKTTAAFQATPGTIFDQGTAGLKPDPAPPGSSSIAS